MKSKTKEATPQGTKQSPGVRPAVVKPTTPLKPEQKFKQTDDSILVQPVTGGWE